MGELINFNEAKKEIIKKNILKNKTNKCNDPCDICPHFNNNLEVIKKDELKKIIDIYELIIINVARNLNSFNKACTDNNEIEIKKGYEFIINFIKDVNKTMNKETKKDNNING